MSNRATTTGVSATKQRKPRVRAKKRGRPEFRPNVTQRKMVKKWVKGGVNQRRIARALGIGVDTLEKHFRKELDAGGAVWEANFECSLGLDVLRPKCPPSLKQFMANVRLGYRELSPRSADDIPPEKMNEAELTSFVAEQERNLQRLRELEGDDGEGDPGGQGAA